MQENNHFGLFGTKQNHRNTEKKKTNHQNQKSDEKNTILHSGKPPPIFVKFLFFFIKVHSFMSTKLCFAENTIKIVFSAEHSF